jgi:hypothetical protein
MAENTKDSVTIHIVVANFNGNVRHDARVERVELTRKPTVPDSWSERPARKVLRVYGIRTTSGEYPNDYKDSD